MARRQLAKQTLKEPEMAHKAFHSQGWLVVVALCFPAASMEMDWAERNIPNNFEH
jgi:hypothetical protein